MILKEILVLALLPDIGKMRMKGASPQPSSKQFNSFLERHSFTGGHHALETQGQLERLQVELLRLGTAEQTRQKPAKSYGLRSQIRTNRLLGRPPKPKEFKYLCIRIGGNVKGTDCRRVPNSRGRGMRATEEEVQWLRVFWHFISLVACHCQTIIHHATRQGRRPQLIL